MYLEFSSRDQAVDHLESLSRRSDRHFVTAALDGDELEAAAADLVASGVPRDLVVVSVHTGVGPRVPGLLDRQTHAACPAFTVGIGHTCYNKQINVYVYSK